MRTAPVALAHLGDDDAIAETARSISALTHADPLAQEACVLWCIAIDRAIRERRLDGVWDGLDLLPSSVRERWAEALRQAEEAPSATFTPNGFVVTALQAAHSVIAQLSDANASPCALQSGLRNAVRVGHDTDTVAAIAGQVLGARFGLTAVPFVWRRILHGWPAYRIRDLVRLAILSSEKGASDSAGWPSAPCLVPHYAKDGSTPVAEPVPDDPGLIIGKAVGLRRALDEFGADAVVSLCRIGPQDVPEGVEHVEVMLLDSEDGNDNLDFVLCDTVQLVTALRHERKTVFLHCAGGTSRTPTIAALYLAHRLGTDSRDGLARLRTVIPDSPWNSTFVAAMGRAEEVLQACREETGR